MNYLSWLIYLANVSDKLSFVMTFMAVATAVAFVIWLIAGCCAVDADYNKDDWRCWRKVGYTLVPIFFVTFIINAILPSKETVYAIAASQVGEQVLKTPLAGKAEHALESWLNKQIKDNGG